MDRSIKVDVSVIPKIKGRHDWESSVGTKIPYVCDEEKGVVEVIDYDLSTSIITLKHEKGTFKTRTAILNRYLPIAISEPDISKGLNYEDTWSYSRNSKTEVECNCIRCNTKMGKLKINNFVTYSHGTCKFCSDGISYPFKFVAAVVEQLFDKEDTIIEYEKVFSWSYYSLNNHSTHGRYDIYVKTKEMQEYVIEVDGGFHRKDNIMSHRTQKDTFITDCVKDVLAEEHNIKIIRIPMDGNKLSVAKKEVLNSKLAQEFDLSGIDWTKCGKQALNSKAKEAAD